MMQFVSRDLPYPVAPPTPVEQVSAIIAPWGLRPDSSVNESSWALWLIHWDSPKYAIPEKRICSDCGAEMRLRSGKFGEFLGCSKYPRCKHTEKCTKQVLG